MIPLLTIPLLNRGRVPRAHSGCPLLSLRSWKPASRLSHPCLGGVSGMHWFALGPHNPRGHPPACLFSREAGSRLSGLLEPLGLPAKRT